MRSLFDSPARALLAGAAIVALQIVFWMALSRPDALGAVSFVLRYLHVVAAMVWIGLIFFTNFIHIPAIHNATDPERKVIAGAYAPRLGSSIKHVARTTLATGLMMLVFTGYAMGSLVYGTEVYLPALRSGPLWGGALAGLAMWALVEFGIAPSLRQILDPAVPPQRKAELRDSVKVYARINLLLMLPVAFAMLLAAHL